MKKIGRTAKAKCDWILLTLAEVLLVKRLNGSNKLCLNLFHYVVYNVELRYLLFMIAEPVTVELELTNPLQIGLSLQQVHLCWEMEPGDESSGERVSNHPSLKLQKDMHQPHNYVETCALEFVSLEAKQTIVVR